MHPRLKAAIDFAPLLVFFITQKLYGIIPATIAIIILSIFSVVIMYYYEKRIAKVPLFTAILLLLLGSITVFTGNPTFIKIKPTIINLLFAMILLFGLAFNRIFLKDLMEEKLKLSDKNWIIFTKRWAYFFFFLAILNEIIWRNFSEDFWVNFKVFGILFLTLIFLFSQRTFLSDGQRD